jgi:hypothetical protein
VIPNTPITDSLLEADVQPVADQHGGQPTAETDDAEGEYSANTVRCRLGDGSWQRALFELGFTAHPDEGEANERERTQKAFDEFVKDFGRGPTATDSKNTQTRLGTTSKSTFSKAGNSTAGRTSSKTSGMMSRGSLSTLAISESAVVAALRTPPPT